MEQERKVIVILTFLVVILSCNRCESMLIISPGFRCNVGVPQYDHLKPTKIYIVHNRETF